jgi:RNA polymerase sigma factor (sigma-70 family)
MLPCFANCQRIIAISTSMGLARNNFLALLPDQPTAPPSRVWERRRRMTSSNNSSDPIVALVLRCQACYRTWQEANEWEQASVLYMQYDEHLQELWKLIAPDLHKIAYTWKESNIEPDVETQALNMFTDICLALPRLPIDPTRNVRSYLLSIARYRLIDIWRHQSKRPRRQGKNHPSDTELHSGSLDARMWLEPPRAVNSGGDGTDSVIASIDDKQILQAIFAYWKKSLSRHDYRIMYLRYVYDTQYSYHEIAKDLGQGWTEPTVRQRHFRIIKATRKYLREQGLI